MSEIVARLTDLHKQATEERSHYYVGKCVRDAIATIAELEKRVAEQRMCVGCGSTQTIEDIRKDHPAALACCPERKMLTLQEWRERADKFEQALTAERQWREEAETERDKFRAYAHEATKALTGLVGGGSEMFAGRIGAGTDREMFKADLPFCVQRIRDRYERSHNALCEAVRREKAAKADLLPGARRVK